MNQNNTAEKLVLVILLVFLWGFGWIPLIEGGISIAGRTGQSYLTGTWALAIAGGAFFYAALTSMLVSKVFLLERGTRYLLVASILIPPALFVLY